MKGQTHRMVTLLEGDYTDDWVDAAIASRIVGMDIETSGLDKYTDRIATVQMFVPGTGTVMVRRLDTHPSNLIRLLQHSQTTKIFHHAPFDIGFLMKNFPVYPKKIACTKIAARFVDPKRERFFHPETLRGSHSLIALTWYFYKETWDKKLAVSDWFAEELSPAQVEYAAKDVEYLPDMLRKLEKELSTLGLLRLARDTYRHIPTRTALELKKLDDTIYEY